MYPAIATAGQQLNAEQALVDGEIVLSFRKAVRPLRRYRRNLTAALRALIQHPCSV